MRPRNRFFLLALIIFLLFGTVPAIHAQTDATVFAPDTVGTVTCADPTLIYSGTISQLGQIQYWAIRELVAGQKLIIDVDAEINYSTLDAYLVVLDKNENIVGLSNDQKDEHGDISLDPYLEFLVPADGDYYIGISSAFTTPPDDPDEDPLDGRATGDYTFLVQCSDQPTPQEFTWPVVVPDLLGATGSNPGSLVNITITPENATTSSPFPLGVGPIADIEYQYSTDTLLVAINENPGSIITFDPATGAQDQTFSLVPVPGPVVPTVVALEAAETELYGVQVDSFGEHFSLVQVTFDDSDPTNPTATLTHVAPLTKTVYALAYHSVDKVMYGVVAGGAGSSGSELVQIDLTSGAFVPVGDPGAGVIVALDFSNDNFLFGVDLSGNLYAIDHTNGQAKLSGDIDVSADVPGLTFVVGEPPDVDPIKAICSSTLTTSASASSETTAPKLSRFKLKKNPLHRAIGLFKFQGKAGETVTINLTSEEEESLEAVVEESSASELENSWLRWKGKGRVFLGIRDSIPGVDYRKRKKEQIPFSMSATLPADGTYYVMLIRPLLRFYKTDYCITLTSDMQEDSQAWETFDVAWPSDDSGDDTASTSAEESKDVQKDTETLAGASADDGSVSVTLSTTAIAPTSAPPEEPVVETPVEAEPALVEVAVEEPVVETPVE
ncbi:MAG: hypothetical protein ACYSWP_15130, partial [Planctomycetota bacterium]